MKEQAFRLSLVFSVFISIIKFLFFYFLSRY